MQPIKKSRLAGNKFGLIKIDKARKKELKNINLVDLEFLSILERPKIMPSNPKG
jgi:hypothetical protein